MNNKKIVHPSDDLTDDDYSNIEDHKTQQEQTIRNNSFYTLVDDKLQSNSHLEDPNKTNDWRTTNNHKGELVMAYDTNVGSNTLRPKTFYALYIGPNDNSKGDLMFKLSIKQILVTTKYQPIHVPKHLTETINEKNAFTNKIQVDHFDNDHSIVQDDYSNNNKDEGQTQCID